MKGEMGVEKEGVKPVKDCANQISKVRFSIKMI